MTVSFSSHFSTSADGKLEIRERDKEEADHTWSTITLVKEIISVEREPLAAKEVTLSVMPCDEAVAENADISFQLSAFHIENPDTSRAFHSTLDLWLSWEQTQALRDYLDFLLSQRDDLSE